MVAPNPLAERRRTNLSSCSVTVPSSWEASVVSGAITNRFAISRPQLNRKGDQTATDQTPDSPYVGLLRMESPFAADQILDNDQGLKAFALRCRPDNADAATRLSGSNG